MIMDLLNIKKTFNKYIYDNFKLLELFRLINQKILK